MARLAPQARTERRKQFIGAAWRCAARQGFAGMTVDDVCAEAGLGKGTFYLYFDNKPALLLALLEDDIEDLDSVLAELDSRALPATEGLRSFLRAMLGRGSDPALVQVRADLWAAMLTETAVRDRAAEAVRRRRATLRRWIDNGLASGELSDVPSNALASLLLALGDGLMLHSALDASGFRWQNIARALNALLGGVTTP